LETVISENIPVNELWPDLFRFNSDPRLVSSFRREDGTSLFAALSFANNHALDHGDRGALDTLRFLESQGVPVSGVSPKAERKWTAFSRKGISFGFYAATFGLNDPSLLAGSALHLNLTSHLSEAEQALREMEGQGLDVKIVSLHWGHEFEPYPTIQQTALAEALVRAGADVVAGSHPHVPQPPEIFLVNGYGSPLHAQGAALRCRGRPRKAIVFYSLGNFLSAMFTAPCRLGTLWALSFRQEPGGVDWTLEPPEFFYGAARNGGRKLVPLSDAPLSPRARARLRRIQDRICLGHLHPLG
jgi:poly-gamma-glutamate synthesis protein (capsule biosynthesis protein)